MNKFGRKEGGEIELAFNLFIGLLRGGNNITSTHFSW